MRAGRVVAWTAIGATTALGMWAYTQHNDGFAVDDSYITFRYADNFANGDGLTFNVGERYYGSTASGYALILGILRSVSRAAGLDVGVPAISTWLSALGLAGFTLSLAVLAMVTIGRRLPLVAGLVSLVLTGWVFVLPGASVVASHETYAFVGLVAIGVVLSLVLRTPITGLAVLAVGAAVRPDGLLMGALAIAGVLVLASLAVLRWRRVLLAAAVFAAIAGSWLLAMRLYYGTWLPGTMDAKRAQVQFGYWPLFTQDTVTAQIDSFFGSPSWRWLLLLAVIGCVVGVVGVVAGLVHRRRAAKGDESHQGGDADQEATVGYGVALACLVWLVFGFGSYAAYLRFDVTIWPWYALPAAFAVLASAAAAVFLAWSGLPLLRPVALRVGYPVVAGVMALLALLPMAGVLADQVRSFTGQRNVNPHLAAYDPVVERLREIAPDGTSVAIAEPGTFGYRLGPSYRVIDVLGLATPGVAQALLSGDRNYPVSQYAPEFVVVSWDGKYNPDQQPGFKDHYRRVAEFASGYFAAGGVPHGIYLYQRI